jgi:unspecific monooxygenase
MSPGSRDARSYADVHRPSVCAVAELHSCNDMFIAAIMTVFLVLAYRRFACPPRLLAPGLPVIPIWVSFLPLFRIWLRLPPLGQDEVYARYIASKMERHGAVIIYFGSRWNVLLGCPGGMKQLFSNEKDLFNKSGNHIKLPNAAISQLTGRNIISETGSVSL